MSASVASGDGHLHAGQGLREPALPGQRGRAADASEPGNLAGRDSGPGPNGSVSEQFFARQDREVIPALLECEEVAGVWTFSSYSTTLDVGRDSDDGVTFAEDDRTSSGQVRIVMVFLDGDPACIWPIGHGAGSSSSRNRSNKASNSCSPGTTQHRALELDMVRLVRRQFPASHPYR